jgi:hypothetical protein
MTGSVIATRRVNQLAGKHVCWLKDSIVDSGLIFFETQR